MAKDVSLRIVGNVDGAEREIRKLQATGQQVASVLEQSFAQLGINSSVSAEAQQSAYVSAYERIRDSGLATWQEVQAAHAAMTAKVTELSATLDPVGAKLSRIDQEIAAMMASGEAVVDRLSLAFEQLGIRSTAAIEKERAATVAAYEQIRNSGVATWQEIQTAHAAMTAKVQALDLESKFGPGVAGAKSFRQHIDDIGGAVDRLTPRFAGLIGTLAVFYVGSKLWDGFRYGIQTVDDFQQAVTKTAAIVASLESGKDIAGNYQRAKEYAAGLNDVLMQVDSRTNLNLTSLQAITEEMIKQGQVLDYTNTSQVEGFTRLANAVAIYSRNGADERQLRQEVSALLKGQVDQNSQLASMLQRTVDGPLKDQVEKWRLSGTLVQELGNHLAGFGPASDDLADSWSAVKSSLETSVGLVARAGFADVVKDVAEWLGKINVYLREHREEIGQKIKSAWEEAKSLMSDAATIVKAIYNNFEPFAALFVGGALLGGLSKAVSLFTTLRDLAVSTRAAMVGIGMISAGSGAAGAATAGGVAGAAGGAAAGSGLMGSLVAGGGALLGGLGLGYALQPVVRLADRGLYNNFGINLTGEEAFRQAQQRDQEADARWRFFQSQNANSPQNRAAAAGGSVIPQLNLGPSQEQIKAELALQEKALAAFKATQEAETASAKEQAAIRLDLLKSSYDQGLSSTRAYYQAEQAAALEAAQQKYQNAAEYLRKEEELLSSIAAKKGTESPEYQEELARNRKAISEMQSAQLAYARTYLDSEEKMTEALKRRDEEYDKLRASVLEGAGEYVEYERQKQAMDDKSIDMLRLRKEAEEGVAGAVEALAAVEKRRAVDLAQAQQKENEAARGYQQEVARMNDQLRVLNGEDADLVKTEGELRDGREKLLTLQDKLKIAWAQSNTAAVSALNQEISLQAQLNQRIQESIDLKNRQGVLNGSIVGFNGNTPIYADSYQREQNANGYISNGQLLPNRIGSGFTVQITGNSPFVDLGSPINGWTGPSFDVGTPYVPQDMIALIHKGERIIPAAQNTIDSFGGGYQQDQLRSVAGLSYQQNQVRQMIDQYHGMADSIKRAIMQTDILVDSTRRLRDVSASIPNRSGTFGSGSFSFVVEGDLNFTLPNVTDRSTAADLAREALPEIMRLMKTRFKSAA